MLKAPTEFIIVFILISVLLILGMALFISMIIYRYQQKQNAYFKDIEALKSSHENTLLQSQLEIQEQTIQKISREIHDNINHKLILVKLHLNTFDFNDTEKTKIQTINSVHIISEVINELGDLSRSMSSEILLNNGLIKALEAELGQLSKSGSYDTGISITGRPVFMEAGNELIIFRMVQEILNNILKHAAATVIDIRLNYSNNMFTLELQDNGKGFNKTEIKQGAGLLSIQKRAAMLKGSAEITSTINAGTTVKIEIPLHESREIL